MRSARRAAAPEVFEFVESLLGREVSADELICCDGDYLFAQKYRDCQDSCPGTDKCALRGYVPRVYEEERRGRRVLTVRAGPCARQLGVCDIRRRTELLRASGIPPELSGCAFETYKPVNVSTGAAKNLAISCAADGTSLVLKGPPGVGKTHLAVAVANSLLSRGRSVFFTSVLNLLDEIYSAVTMSRINTLLERILGFDCLVLDDAGMNQSKPAWRNERLYEIVNNRYNERKQLLVTTNARDNEEFKSMFGEAGPQIESRLSRMAAFFTIDAPDYRKRKKNNAKGGEAA